MKRGKPSSSRRKCKQCKETLIRRDNEYRYAFMRRQSCGYSCIGASKKLTIRAGDLFGSWTAIENASGATARVMVKCACGKTGSRELQSLVHGRSKSCRDCRVTKPACGACGLKLSRTRDKFCSIDCFNEAQAGKYELFGEKLTIRQLASVAGTPYQTMLHRISRTGLSAAAALAKPKASNKRAVPK